MDADEAYKEIIEEIIPEAVALFKKKAGDHRGAPHFLMLGAPGQFAELNKKFWKLYNAVWQGNTLIGEPVDEVCEDMIGHLFLMLYCLRHPAKPTRVDCSCPADQPEGSYAAGCVYHEEAQRIADSYCARVL